MEVISTYCSWKTVVVYLDPSDSLVASMSRFPMLVAIPIASPAVSRFLHQFHHLRSLSLCPLFELTSMPQCRWQKSCSLLLHYTSVPLMSLPWASYSYQKSINIYERAQSSRQDKAEVQKEESRTVWGKLSMTGHCPFWTNIGQYPVMRSRQYSRAVLLCPLSPPITQLYREASGY